jgi:hypothetical protein
MLPANDVGAFQRSRLEQLAAQPNTTVYEPTFASVREAWRTDEVRPLLERIATRVTAFPPETADFVVRKTCLDDPDILRFQRAHPKLYSMVTDRKMVQEPKFRATIAAMLEVRTRVEKGLIPPEEADAAATKAIITALS